MAVDLDVSRLQQELQGIYNERQVVTFIRTKAPCTTKSICYRGSFECYAAKSSWRDCRSMSASAVTFLAGVGAEDLQEDQPISVGEHLFLAEEDQAEGLVLGHTLVHKIFEGQALPGAETYPNPLQIAYQTVPHEAAMVLETDLVGTSHRAQSEIGWGQDCHLQYLRIFKDRSQSHLHLLLTLQR